MKEYDVTITEKLQMVVTVEAESRAEAERLVNEQWAAGDHVLDYKNFVDAEFEASEGHEIAQEKQAENTMDVLIIEPGQYPRMETVGTGLEALQTAVGGDIQAVYPYDDPVAIICDEEGKLNGSSLNRALRDEDGEIVDILAGTFLVCGLGEEDFTSLPEELRQKYEEKFHQPEAFLKMGTKIMAIPTEPAKPAARKEKNSPVNEL